LVTKYINIYANKGEHIHITWHKIWRESGNIEEENMDEIKKNIGEENNRRMAFIGLLQGCCVLEDFLHDLRILCLNIFYPLTLPRKLMGGNFHQFDFFFRSSSFFFFWLVSANYTSKAKIKASYGS
jgi:hypothetical protein